jgi:cyclopropane-fatty-acyl-phospholipid synthase
MSPSDHPDHPDHPDSGTSGTSAPPGRDGLGIRLAEAGLLPDALIRLGIRRLCRERLAEETAGGPEATARRRAAFIASMSEGPVAPVPEKANEQHYEVPAAFYEHCLGARRKYSSCHYPPGVTTLDAAEEAALTETCAHAELADGQHILELGCGWGSLTLWMAEQYPAARITAVSNSRSQRAHIMGEAERRGLGNITVITADMNDFDAAALADPPFDRIVSVEMFEHMRNWPELLRRAAGWLRPDGRMFLHVFAHRKLVYPFQTEGRNDWMGRYFFSGGIMPSVDLASHFGDDLRVRDTWVWDGTHYGRTSEDWLANLDRNRAAVMPILAETYGAKDARRWFHRWRMFFLACAELFAMDGGREWVVVHWLLEPVATASRTAEEPAAAGAG